MIDRIFKPIPLIIIAILLLIAMGVINKCSREKQAAERAEKHEQIINRNKDNSTIEAQYRASKDSLIQAFSDSLAYHKERTKQLESHDTQIVIRYIKTPTLDNGKAVIASKDKVILGLKGESKIKDKVILEKDQQLESYGNEVQQHKLTINELDKEFQKLNGQLAKAKKPKTWNLSVSAGYGVPVTDLSKPVPFVGVTVGKSIIRW